MDQLSYTYDTAHDKDNRLLRVNDPTPDQLTYYDDIKRYTDTDTQYFYDAIGNLSSDNSGGVTKTINWNVYGKIAQVVQSNGILVRYGYDAQGQRICKRFSSDNGQNWRYVYYVRDATGNVLAVYEQTEVPRSPRTPNQSPTILGTLALTEQPLYGSSRLGERQLSLAMGGGTPSPDAYQRVVGQKRYELTDHLGNVRALVSDVKLVDVAGTFKPDLRAYYNYYPFGMLQPNRNGPGTKSLAGGYRYGYNGKEMDNNGELGLTSYDYGFRIYNPGLGKFLSVDPLTDKFPWYSPYHFAGNSPVANIDMDGLEPRLAWLNDLAKWFGYDMPSNVEHADNIEEEAARQRGLAMRQKGAEVYKQKLERLLDAQQTAIGVFPGSSIINGSVNVSVGRETTGEAATGVAFEAGLTFIPYGKWAARVGGRWLPTFFKDVDAILEGIGAPKYITREVTEGFKGARTKNEFREIAISVRNKIRDHLGDTDISGMVKEYHGTEIPGGYHINEVQDQLDGLRGDKRRLLLLFSQGEFEGKAAQEAGRLIKHIDNTIRYVEALKKSAEESAAAQGLSKVVK